MKFEKYDSYKDSGIDWLGEIPSEWKVKRVKDLGGLQNGISQDANYFGEGFPFVSYGHIYNDTIDVDKIKTLAKSSREDQKLYSVKEGDVFFTRTSETVDEIGFSGTCQKTIEKAIFSGFTIRLRPSKKKIWRGFSKYYFKASSNRNFFVKNMNIVTRASLGQGLLNQLPTLLPPKDTQEKIASFLDEQSLTIDRELSILEQKIEKYKELKQTIITEAVVRGLDKNVVLKSSEITWIGDIPKHWEIKRFKDIAILSTGNSMSNKEDYEISIDAYPYIATKDINIGTNHIDYDNGVYVPKTDLKYKVASKYTTLLCIEGGSAGKKVAFLNKPVCYVNKLCNIKSKSSMFSKYTYYYVASHSFRLEFFSYINGLIGGVSTFTLKTFSISVPPYEEQVAIANYLDEKTSKIDSIVEVIGKKIDVLKEFRKTLINDVVTGKVKVA